MTERYTRAEMEEVLAQRVPLDVSVLYMLRQTLAELDALKKGDCVVVSKQLYDDLTQERMELVEVKETITDLTARLEVAREALTACVLSRHFRDMESKSSIQ